MASKPVLSGTPTIDQATKAWTKGFAAAVRSAAGPSKRLTPNKANGMTGMYADNAQNYFEKTGRSWATVDTVIESGSRYVRAQVTDKAGPNGKLSLTETRALNADLSGDILTLRGKAPAALAADAPSAAQLLPLFDAANHKELNDYGKEFGVTTYPASATRVDILRDLVGYSDLEEAQLNEWFSSTHGSQAVSHFASSIKDAGAEEHANRDEDPSEALSGAAAEKLFVDLADGVKNALTPASKVKSIEYAEHFIVEDGDLEIRALLARQKDDSWLVLSYTNFPF